MYSIYDNNGIGSIIISDTVLILTWSKHFEKITSDRKDEK